MLAFTARRLAQAVIVALLLTLFTFFLLHLLPGGPAKAILGPKGYASLAQRRAFLQENGFNNSVLVQYWDYLKNLAHGNLGYSFIQNQTVDSIFANDLPKSLVLVGSSTILALAIGIGLGLFQAVRVNRWDDYTVTGVTFFVYAMPDFFLAQIMVEVFAIHLHWFSTEGPQGPTWTSAFTDWRDMVLPVVTLTALSIAGISRYARSSALDVFGQDFIRTARSKGAKNSRVLAFHTLRNSMGPIVTLVGLSLPGIFGGAFIIEDVFNYPGIGLATISATEHQDYPVILGTTILFGVLTIVGNLIADLMYAWFDPRVRLQ